MAEVSRAETTEVAGRAAFAQIRYAQCWEDADVLLEALDIGPDHRCVSIASAGDNALAMLSRGPEQLVAVDLSKAQIACLELRVAAFRELSHAELLGFTGSTAWDDRLDLYRRCRAHLSVDARAFWDSRIRDIKGGIGGAGKFERYFALFRRFVLPLVHSRRCIDELLRGGTREQREEFYTRRWNNRRWRMLFRLFFSRPVMGRLGRDPGFFQYVEGGVANRILTRTRSAVVDLDPAENPYLQWIVAGRHITALPCWLRPENYAAIRANLDRLEWRCCSLEEYLAEAGCASIDRFNLSDIFEYMSEGNYHQVLACIRGAARPDARLAYWNMMVPRSRPESMADRLRPLSALASALHARDKAFFYGAFVVEEAT